MATIFPTSFSKSYYTIDFFILPTHVIFPALYLSTAILHIMALAANRRHASIRTNADTVKVTINICLSLGLPASTFLYPKLDLTEWPAHLPGTNTMNIHNPFQFCLMGLGAVLYLTHFSNYVFMYHKFSIYTMINKSDAKTAESSRATS